MPKYSSSELYEEILEALKRLKEKGKDIFNLTMIVREVNEIRREKGIEVEVKLSSVSNVMKKLQRLGIAKRDGNLWVYQPPDRGPADLKEDQRPGYVPRSDGEGISEYVYQMYFKEGGDPVLFLALDEGVRKYILKRKLERYMKEKKSEEN